MVDYQIYQTWALILQAIFTVIMAFLTAALVYLTHQYSKATKQYADATDNYVATNKHILSETANYAETTKEMFKASIIERQINYTEKRLEKLYMPIHNNQQFFDHILIAPIHDTPENQKFIAEIKPYTYLADDPLRTNLEKLLNELGAKILIERGTISSSETKEHLSELIKDIQKQLNAGYNKDKLLLTGMIEEHEIKIRKTISKEKSFVQIK